MTSASLIWSATPLTTAKFFATTSIDETTLPGVSGVLTNIYTAEVDHDFRRWLTAVGRFTYGTQAYQGDARFDRFYSLSGDLIYKLSREVWIKGTVRRDILDSNVARLELGGDRRDAGREAAAVTSSPRRRAITAADRDRQRKR